MACCPNIITSGILSGCLTNTGGLKKIYITDHCQVLGVTKSNGTITDILMASGAGFYEFTFARNSASLSEPATITLENGTTFYNTSVVFTIPRRAVAKRNSIQTLANKRLVIITEDQNGEFNFIGLENGAELTAQEGGSGQAKSDLNGYILTITAEEPEMAYHVDPAIIEALIIE